MSRSGNHSRSAESNIVILAVRKPKTCAIFIKMVEDGRRNEFRQSLKSFLNHEATVKDLIPAITLEIRDVNALTTIEEVLVVVQSESGPSNLFRRMPALPTYLLCASCILCVMEFESN